MKTRIRTERIGENLGPIDWRYDFEQHGWDREGGTNPEFIQQGILALWECDAAHGRGEVCLYQCWHRVLDCGMYDGWPYWRPVPSVCIDTAFGAEWHSFLPLREFRRH